MLQARVKSRKRTILISVFVAVVCTAPFLASGEVVKRGPGTLVGPAFTADTTDEGRVTVTNIGRGTVMARVLYLRATDFTELAASEAFPIGPFESKVFDESLDVVIPAEFPVLVVVQYNAARATDLRITLQIKDILGGTTIFTDGFEAGIVPPDTEGDVGAE